MSGEWRDCLLHKEEQISDLKFGLWSSVQQVAIGEQQLSHPLEHGNRTYLPSGASNQEFRERCALEWKAKAKINAWRNPWALVLKYIQVEDASNPSTF